MDMSYRSVLWKTIAFSAIAFQQPLFCHYNDDLESEDEYTAPFYEDEDEYEEAPAYPRSSPIAYRDNSDQEMNSSQPDSIELNSRLQIGANYTFVTFKPRHSHSFNGNLGGAQAIYEYRPMDNFYAGAKFLWRQGTMHRHSEKRTFTNYDGQERLGYTFCDDNWDISPYTGFGYHYLRQKLSPSSGGSLRFRYNEFYVPLGFVSNYCFNSWFTAGLDFTWMPQVFSSVSIVPLGGARWSLKDTLANFYVSIPHTFTLTKNKRLQIILNPYYEHWEDGKSTAKLASGIALGLPKNVYNFYGIDVNFAYRF